MLFGVSGILLLLLKGGGAIAIPKYGKKYGIWSLDYLFNCFLHARWWLRSSPLKPIFCRSACPPARAAGPAHPAPPGTAPRSPCPGCGLWIARTRGAPARVPAAAAGWAPGRGTPRRRAGCRWPAPPRCRCLRTDHVQTIELCRSTLQSSAQAKGWLKALICCFKYFCKCVISVNKIPVNTGYSWCCVLNSWIILRINCGLQYIKKICKTYFSATPTLRLMFSHNNGSCLMNHEFMMHRD